MRRIGYFLITNLAIMLVLGIVLTLAQGFLIQQGIQLPMGGVLLFAVIFGMGGSFISLWTSKWMAKRAYGAHVIEEPRNDSERWLFETVRRQANAVGIGMPEVAIYDSPAPNAFATGAKRNDALVAVSTGLLRSMRKEEVEAVLGHEVSHVANGDMITLTLIQGVLNTFVLIFSRMFGLAMRGERDSYLGYMVGTIVAQIVLGVLASMVVMYFSRKREFRADEGAAQLEGPGKMIAALEALQRGPQEPLAENMAAFGISGGTKGFSRLFMTHPPIEERIEALRRQEMMGTVR